MPSDDDRATSLSNEILFKLTDEPPKVQGGAIAYVLAAFLATRPRDDIEIELAVVVKTAAEHLSAMLKLDVQRH